MKSSIYHHIHSHTRIYTHTVQLNILDFHRFFTSTPRGSYPIGVRGWDYIVMIRPSLCVCYIWLSVLFKQHSNIYLKHTCACAVCRESYRLTMSWTYTHVATSAFLDQQIILHLRVSFWYWCWWFDLHAVIWCFCFNRFDCTTTQSPYHNDWTDLVWENMVWCDSVCSRYVWFRYGHRHSAAQRGAQQYAWRYLQ